MEQTTCPEFPFFGARYPDATCIDGYLWDLDKFEDGQLYGGGEIPCPFCNKESFIDYEYFGDETANVAEILRKRHFAQVANNTIDSDGT